MPGAAIAGQQCGSIAPVSIRRPGRAPASRMQRDTMVSRCPRKGRPVIAEITAQGTPAPAPTALGPIEGGERDSDQAVHLLSDKPASRLTQTAVKLKSEQGG